MTALEDKLYRERETLRAQAREIRAALGLAPNLEHADLLEHLRGPAAWPRWIELHPGRLRAISKAGELIGDVAAVGSNWIPDVGLVCLRLLAVPEAGVSLDQAKVALLSAVTVRGFAGIDRWRTVPDIAALLGCTPEAVLEQLRADEIEESRAHSREWEGEGGRTYSPAIVRILARRLQ